VCVQVCVNCAHVYLREKEKERERERERETGRTDRESSTLRFLEGVSVGGSVAVSDSASVKPLRSHSCQNTHAQACTGTASRHSERYKVRERKIEREGKKESTQYARRCPHTHTH